MKFTIGRKLTFSFLLLALLVLVSGLVGIMVLNKVSQSADAVAKEKVPIQYSVMKASLTVEKIEKVIADYIHSSSDLNRKEKNLQTGLDEFDMWISMLENGTLSDTFTKSTAHKTYQTLGLRIIVPQTSKNLLETVGRILKESTVFRKSCTDLLKPTKTI